MPRVSHLKLDRSTIAAVPLFVTLLAACAPRGEAGSPPAKQPEPVTQQPGPEQPAPNAGAAGPSSLEQGEGSELTTIEAAEAEFSRVSRELDALWTEAEKPEAKARDEFSACDPSCKAFLSLERAAAAICRLAGDADSRCAQAKKTVEKNRQRIADCACS